MSRCVGRTLSTPASDDRTSFARSRFPCGENLVLAPKAGCLSPRPNASKQFCADWSTLICRGHFESQRMVVFFWLCCGARRGPRRLLEDLARAQGCNHPVCCERTGQNGYSVFQVLFPFPRPSLLFAARGLITLFCTVTETWDEKEGAGFPSTSTARPGSARTPPGHQWEASESCAGSSRPGHHAACWGSPDTSSRNVSLCALEDRVFLACEINDSTGLKTIRRKGKIVSDAIKTT